MKTNFDAGGARGAWSPAAHQEVNGLRRAITAHLTEPMVASPMAPMMGELLARLEGFAEPPRAAALQAPASPPELGPMSASAASEALHQACGALRERVLSAGEDPRSTQSLQAMVEVIEDHLRMKGEILARCASDATPG